MKSELENINLSAVPPQK